MEREGEKRRQASALAPAALPPSPRPTPPISSASSEELDKTPMPRPARLASSITSESEGEATPTGRTVPLAENMSDEGRENDSSALRRFLAVEVEREDVELGPAETTPLLGGQRTSRWVDRARQDLRYARRRASKITAQDVARECIVEPIKTIPSVILGLLLNVLDGVSYGMIL